MAISMISSLSTIGNYNDMQVGENKELHEITAVFSAMMNQQQDFSTSMAEFHSFDASTKEISSSNTVSDSYEKYSYKEYHIKETDFKEKLEEVSGELKEFEQEALDKISEEFGIEKDEIMAVLEEMGLSVMDLLNPQNLANFVMELTGITTKEDLLLNDSFLSIMSTMDSMKKDLMSELDVMPEELQQIVELMEMEKVDTDSEQIVEFVEQEADTKKVDFSDENANNDSTDTNQQSEQPFITVSSDVKPILSTENFQINSYLNENTMDIMEQIVERLRVDVTAGKNTMEMQLNPEHLGKIYVSISEENGVINAQFTATNEIVKEALESQLATLRENLNQAGVKVDAIEVTVETHQFEHNLEQNHKREENEGAYKEELVQKRRNLSLNELDELSGIMTEEEALVAQIMKDNGNSVDLTA